METSFRLRRARPEDAEAILQVHRAAIRGTASAYYPREVIESWAPLPLHHAHVDALARRIDDEVEEAIVALLPQGPLIGFGSFVPDNRELRAVYVRPDHGRRGVGAALLRALELRAGKYGLAELVMDASLNAEAFYRRHGFTVEREGEHVLRDGCRMACIRMRKQIGAPQGPRG